MTDAQALREHILNAIKSLTEDPSVAVADSTALIGDGRVLDSMRLVELCLLLEDKALEIGFEFDWTSEVAMSKSRSMFRTAGSLANEFISQMELKK
jgi:acyl carrier protein